MPPNIVSRAPFTLSVIRYDLLSQNLLQFVQAILRSGQNIRHNGGTGGTQLLCALMPSGLQHTPHAQRLGNLKIVDRIPDHNSLRRYGAALLQFSQISQADFHFAAGVNIIQPQQAVKVGAHSALRDLLFQNRQVGRERAGTALSASGQAPARAR